MALQTLKTNQRGQAFIETVASGMLFYGMVFFAFGIILNFTVQNLLTRWAYNNSRCIAMTDNHSACGDKTKSELRRYFGLSNVEVVSRPVNGTIHSKLSVKLIGSHRIVGKFDLMAREYRRVK